MDFLFINPITFELSPSPQLGQLILHNIVQKKFETSWVNFDLLTFVATTQRLLVFIQFAIRLILHLNYRS